MLLEITSSDAARLVGLTWPRCHRRGEMYRMRVRPAAILERSVAAALTKDARVRRRRDPNQDGELWVAWQVVTLRARHLGAGLALPVGTCDGIAAHRASSTQ